MASSRATTVAAYLAELPPERRKEIAAVRALVRKHLPKGYQEAMGYGMITWAVPLSAYPHTRDSSHCATRRWPRRRTSTRST